MGGGKVGSRETLGWKLRGLSTSASNEVSNSFIHITVLFAVFIYLISLII